MNPISKSLNRSKARIPVGAQTEKSQAKDWNHLPANVVDCILKHVPTKQMAAMRLVSSHWRSCTDLNTKTLVTNPRYPTMMPVAEITERFPMISNLDLTCQAWGYGQSLTPASTDQLSSLGVLKCLRSVKLVNWVTLPLSGFREIIGLNLLKELDVSNCVAVTDNYLRCFRSIQSNLRTLILNGCVKITDSGVTHLSTLFSLTDLRLACVSGIIGETLNALSPSLETLDLSFCENVTDSALRSVIECSAFGRSLRSLSLTGCQNVKSTTLASLGSVCTMNHLKISYLGQEIRMESWTRFAELHVLDVSYATGLNLQEALPVIGKMTGLRTLRMSGCVRAQGLNPARLSDLKQLRVLELCKWANIQFGLDVADCLPSLEILNLAGSYGPIENARPYFKNCPKLKVLSLSKIAFLPQNVVKGIGSIPSLEILNLSGLGNLSNSVIREISKATNLKHLDLSQNGMFCRVTNTGALHLQNLKALRSLKISGWTEVTQNGFVFLRYLINMTSLDLSSCSKITNKVVRAIVDCLPELTEVNLANCFQLSVEGLIGLAKLRELETVKLPISLKGDLDNQLSTIKNLQLVSPLDAIREDFHPSYTIEEAENSRCSHSLH